MTNSRMFDKGYVDLINEFGSQHEYEEKYTLTLRKLNFTLKTGLINCKQQKWCFEQWLLGQRFNVLRKLI